MQCLLLFAGFSLFLLPVVYAVKIATAPTAIVNVSTNVTWTRQATDPTLFDLRFVSVQDRTDLGLALHIDVMDGQQSRTENVTFPTQGQISLVAVADKKGDQHIGESGVIHVDPVAPITPVSPINTSTQLTSTIPPSSTVAVTATSTTPSSTDSSSIAGSTRTPSSAISISGPNAAAIAGGTLGGVALIFILAILFIVIKRRKNAKEGRRLSFKRHLMVQNRSDIEQGHGIGPSPVLPPLTLQPTLDGSTRSPFPATTPRSSGPTNVPTHRQVQLGTRIVQLEQQISSIRRQNRGQAGMGTMLEHMKKQVEWLRAERDSPWARCETDVPPPMLDSYME